MRTWLISRNAKEPVSLARAKQYCRAPAGTADDELIQYFISAARAKAERFADLSIVPCERVALIRAVELKSQVYSAPTRLDRDRISSLLELPRGPLVSVEEMHIVDPEGNETTFTDYRHETGSDLIFWTDGAPAFFGRHHVKVRYKAGFDAAPDEQAETVKAPEDVQLAILLMVSDMYEFRGDEDGPIPRRAAAYLKQYKRVRVAG